MAVMAAGREAVVAALAGILALVVMAARITHAARLALAVAVAVAAGGLYPDAAALLLAGVAAWVFLVPALMAQQMGVAALVALTAQEETQVLPSAVPEVFTVAAAATVAPEVVLLEEWGVGARFASSGPAQHAPSRQPALEIFNQKQK